MREKILLILFCVALLSCRQKKNTLSIHVANYTQSTKKVNLRVSPSIKLERHEDPLKVIPSWVTWGDFNISKGVHSYMLNCEGIEATIIDSFDLKEDSYLTITLRDDLNKNYRKDSFTVTFMKKSEKVEFQ